MKGATGNEMVKIKTTRTEAQFSLQTYWQDFTYPEIQNEPIYIHFLNNVPPQNDVHLNNPEMFDIVRTDVDQDCGTVKESHYCRNVRLGTFQLGGVYRIMQWSKGIPSLFSIWCSVLDRERKLGW